MPFIDVVNQDDGHQLRFRRAKKCCRVPRVAVFADGQSIGHVSRTMRCWNRCLTCLEDVQGKPVLQVGLHDENGNKVGRIDRSGAGCCCKCSCEAPMKCVGCCFVCLTCTAIAKPSEPVLCCGCLDCDPVCCETCVKSEKAACAFYSCPLLCCGLPCAAPTCCCPIPTVETKRLPATSTVRFDNFAVMNGEGSEQLGHMQALYRGNYPSAYLHNADMPLKERPLKVTGQVTNKKAGQLLAAVAAGMSYNFGALSFVFDKLVPRLGGRSPGYDGVVEAKSAVQIKKMLGIDQEPTIRADTMIVGDDCILGDVFNGVQVRGWKLVEIGWSKSVGTCCSIQGPGDSRAMRHVKTLEEARTIAKIPLENMLGEFGCTFWLKFELPDQEKGVVGKGMNLMGDVSISNGFNPPRGGYVDQLESVNLACVCFRCWKFPCNFNTDKYFCCTCPLYARTVSNNQVIPSSAWEQAPPPSVVMNGIPSQKFGKA